MILVNGNIEMGGEKELPDVLRNIPRPRGASPRTEAETAAADMWSPGDASTATCLPDLLTS